MWSTVSAHAILTYYIIPSVVYIKRQKQDVCIHNGFVRNCWIFSPTELGNLMWQQGEENEHSIDLDVSIMLISSPNVPHYNNLVLLLLTAGFKVCTPRVEVFENIIITFENFLKRRRRRKPDKPPVGLKKFHFFCAVLRFSLGARPPLSPAPTNLCIWAIRKGKLSRCVLAVLISVSFILSSIPLLPLLLFWLPASSCLYISPLCLSPPSLSPFPPSVLGSARFCGEGVCERLWFRDGYWALPINCFPPSVICSLARPSRFLDTAHTQMCTYFQFNTTA